ncbi:MAG: transposase [Elusimicrobia bacterium]|nr:transposase [Elusimicrobiota bacterium]
MSRGNGGEPIFLEDEDFAEFTRLLQKARQRFRFELYAYCLMPNHFHLLLRQHIAAISQIMQWLLTCYAQTFNRWRSRRGHLFQGRFLSPACEDDRYFLGLLRYIHLNPARSRLVQKPEEWKWSGHEELKRPEKNGLLDVDFPLSLFHADKSIAAEEYERFLAKSANGGRTLDDGTDLADMGFIPNDVLVADASCQETVSGPTESVAELAAQVCAERNLGLSAMRGNSKSRSLAQARRMLIQQAVERGIRPSEIAAFLNRVPSAVSNLLRDMYRHGT